MSEPRATNRPYSRYNTQEAKPFRQIHNMPLSLRQLVCTCETVDVTKWKWYDILTWHPGLPNTDYHILVCNSCRKPDSYNLHKCIDCGEVFLKDFYATFCYDMPRCWNCTHEFPTGCSNVVGTCIEVDRNKWVPSVLPKPKVYADGELDAFLDAYLE